MLLYFDVLLVLSHLDYGNEMLASLPGKQAQQTTVCDELRSTTCLLCMAHSSYVETVHLRMSASLVHRR